MLKGQKGEIIVGKHGSVPSLILRCMLCKLDMLTKSKLSTVSEFNPAQPRLLPRISSLHWDDSSSSQGCVCPWGKQPHYEVEGTTISNHTGRHFIVSGVYALQIEISCLPQGECSG